MINRFALIASAIMLIAVAGAATAGAPKARPQASAIPSAARTAYDFYAADSMTSSRPTGPGVRRYYGGPKYNN